MRRRLYILTTVAILLAGCSGQTENSVHFNRFEHLLFNTPLPQLQKTLLDSLPRYSTPLLNVAPADPQFMQVLAGFVSDPEVRRIYNVTDSLYGNLAWLEAELSRALERSHKLIPELQYTDFYTLVTADFNDYSNRVFCSLDELAISIDRYAVGELPGAVPAYIENISRREYIAADCMAAIARAHIALPDGDLTLLDYTVAEGKALYYVQQTLPHTHDTILMRYTGEQLAWMKDNVAPVWGWLIQNKLLYSTDIGQFHNIIDDAPHTNAFGQVSAPRTTAYIGLQIVSRFMKKSGATMQQLFDNTDSRAILTASGWRP